mgnify:CR=1 FL=1
MWEMWRTCREALACVLYGAHVVHYKVYTIQFQFKFKQNIYFKHIVSIGVMVILEAHKLEVVGSSPLLHM